MKIALFTLATLLLLGCSDEKQGTTEQSSAAKTPVEKTQTTVASTKVEEKTTVTQEPKKVESVEPVATKVEKKVEVPVKAASVEKAVERKVEAPVVATKIDGAVLFKGCVSCHGANAQKKALGKSQIIQGWESSKTLAALKGYKDGSYGSSMKGVMKAQVTKFSDDELKALAEYISTL